MMASTTLLPAIGVCGITSDAMNRTRPMIAAVSMLILNSALEYLRRNPSGRQRHYDPIRC